MIMKTFILAVLVITIIHLTIRYLLQSNVLYKSRQVVSSSTLEEMFSGSNHDVEENKSISELDNKNDSSNPSIDNNDETEDDDTEYDLKKMKEELMDYIIGDKELYKGDQSYPVLPDDTSNQTESNYNFSSKNEEDNNISKFFETKMNENDYTLYTAKEDNSAEEKSVKKKEIGTDDLGRWEYDNENVINGGDIDNGLKGYDLSDSIYANIN